MGFDVILMCAGAGTRLLPLTENVPKTLVEVKGKPIIQHIVDNIIKIVDKINPIPANSEKYKEIFPIFKECYSVLVPMFDKLAYV